MSKNEKCVTPSRDALMDALRQVMGKLPDDRLQQLLDYAGYLGLLEEQSAWSQGGPSSLEEKYGLNEVEYSDADIKPELSR